MNDVEHAPGSYRYDAFISYRHAEPDRTWARWLQVALESYRTPRVLVRDLGLSPRLSRVFRDEDELPASADLSADIESALEQSRFLIVVCSPRTPASAWVNQEIIRFRELGRDGRILALLVEGEPADAFPDALREIRREVTNAAGRTRVEIEEVEPLAADVRPSRKDPPRWLKRMAKLRVMACLLGCRFDDLRRREQERRTRRLLAGGAVLLGLLALLAGLSVVALRQRAAAEAARGEAHERLLDFHVEQGRRELLAGDRLRALVYLNEAIQGGRDTPLVRFLLARARTVLDAQGPVLAGGEGEIRFASFAADDTRIVLVDDTPTARVFDAHTGKELARIDDLDPEIDHPSRAVLIADDRTHAVLHVRHDERPALVGYDLAGLGRTWFVEGAPGPPRASRLATAGSVLAEGTADGRIRLFDVVTGTGRGEVRAHGEPLMVLALDSGGTRAVALTLNGECALWDVGAASVRRIPVPSGVTEPPRFVDEGRRLLFLGPQRLWLVDVATGTLVLEQPIDGWHGFSATASPDGSALLVQRPYGPLQLWAAGRDAGADPTPRLEWDHGHGDLVSQVAFARGSPRLATASWDGTVRVWDLPGAEQRLLLEGHAGGIKCVAWSADGRRLVTGSNDRTGRVWNLDAGSLRRRLVGGGGGVLSIRNGPREGWVAALANDGHVTIWDVQSGRRVHHLSPPTGAWGAALDAVGERVAYYFADGSAVVLDVLTGERLRAARGHDAPIVSVGFGPQGDLLSASQDGTGRIWRADGSPAVILRGHEGSVFWIVSDAEGRTLATAGMDASLRLWDAGSGAPIRVLRMEGVVSLGMPAFSPSGEALAARTNDGSVVVWDAGTGEERCVLAGHGDRGARAFRFSPGGERLATAGEDGVTRVWDCRTGRLLFSLRRSQVGRAGMDDEISDVAFDPAGSFLATADGDGRFRIWELERGRLVDQLAGDGGASGCCVYLPDGSGLLTGSDGGTVLLHDISLESRAAPEIGRLVTERVPYRLAGGVLVPRED